MVEKIKKNKYIILLIITLFLGIILRFYNTPSRYSFGDDSTRDAIVALIGAREMQLPLTGPFSSLGPFTFGPWYFYQIILFQLLTRIDFAPWIYLGLASVIFIYVMYKIGELLADKKLGIIFAILSAFSPIQIYTAIGLTNPNLIPVFAALSFFLFLKLLRRENTIVAYLFGLVLGIGINIHYQMGGLLVLPFLFVTVRRKRIKDILFIFLGIFTACIPLLLFDLNNHWFTTRNLFETYFTKIDRVAVPNSWKLYIGNFWPSYFTDTFGGTNVTSSIIIIFTILATALSFWKRKITKEMLLIYLAFLIDFIYLRYYKGPRFTGYLLFLQPFIFITVGYSIWSFLSFKNGKYFVALLLLGYLAIVIPKVNSILKDNDPFFGQFTSQKAILRQKFPNKNILLYNCKEHYRFRTQAVAYLLSLENTQYSSNVKIGFLNEHCPSLGLSATKNVTLKKDSFSLIKGIDAADITLLSGEEIKKMGLERVSAEQVFKTTTRWWFKEQP